MQIQKIIDKTLKELSEDSLQTPLLDIEIILSEILNIDKKNLFFYKNKCLTQKQFDVFNNYINQRKKHKPIAKIINKKSFWDYEFFVNENVLDPRPDSEILIETILKYKTDENEKFSILDLGTGSGALIITLLKIYKNASGTAIDINKKSLNVAKFNAVNLNVSKRITFLQNNWNDNFNEKFDLIISNPPYIGKKTINNLSKDIQFDPYIALDGGNNGLDCYKYLLQNLSKNCKKHTKIFFEIGSNQLDKIKIILKKNNFNFVRCIKDLFLLNRVIYFEC